MVQGQGTKPRADRAAQSTGLLFDATMRSGISGFVRDRGGRPQVGAVVELLNAESDLLLRTFTDDRGHYSLPRLSAGWYQVQASNTLFLPALRPDLRLLANSKAVVNLTLSTVAEALNWLPTQPRDAHSSDDWDWTLRLATNRPLLRFQDHGQANEDGENDGGSPATATAVVVEAERRDSTLVQVRQGLLQFGNGGWEQQVAWRAPADGDRALLFRARTSVAGGEPGHRSDLFSGTIAYRRELSPGRSWTTVANLSDRPSIHSATGDGLAMVRVRSASTARLLGLATVTAGTELEAARLGDGPAALASHPFATVTVGGGSMELEYRVSTAPSITGAGAPEAMDENAPALVENNGRLAMEAGLHQELRLHRRLGSWTAEAALFEDTLAHPVVQGSLGGSLGGSLQRAVPGIGRGSEATIDSDDVLYDPGNGIIAVSGRGYSHGGVMGLLRDQLSPDTWLSLRYAMGNAESLAEPLVRPGVSAGPSAQTEISPQVAAPGGTPGFEAHPASSVTVAGGTRLPIIHTAIRAGYHWQPVATVTPVAPFATERDDLGAYLGFSVRQPLLLEHAAHGRLEAVLDVRNLLAQGYRPFLSEDGTMVYFAQSQRCFAAGFAFSF